MELKLLLVEVKQVHERSRPLLRKLKYVSEALFKKKVAEAANYPFK